MAFTFTCLACLSFALMSCFGQVSIPQMENQHIDDVMTMELAQAGALNEARLNVLEDALHPMYASMPKSSDHGSIAAPAARHVLHRYFVEQHAWYVKGLDRGTSPGNGNRAQSKKEYSSNGARDYFGSSRMEGKSYSLHELAVLAATLEKFVLDESVDRLHGAYRATGLGLVVQKASVSEIEKAIDTYMMIYILGMNQTTMSLKDVQLKSSTIGDSYPTWPETQAFVRQLRESLLGKSKRFFDLADAQLVVDEIGSRYGRWQDRECKDLKNSLVDIEHQGTGRVLLGDFYKAALAGQWQFSESSEYLRELKALDESDPDNPSVIVPNYLNSPSNCVSSSEFYDVCCLDECEPLFSHIERRIAAPQATPRRIIQLVEALPSATVDAPRILSPALRAKLDEIAYLQGGLISLHSRLFAQWMHHVYPRECSFPQSPNTTLHASAESTSTHASNAEMQKIANLPRLSSNLEIPWTTDDILYLSSSTPGDGPRDSLLSMARSFFAFAAVASVILGLCRTLSSSMSSLGPVKRIWPAWLGNAPRTPAGRRVVKELAKTTQKDPRVVADGTQQHVAKETGETEVPVITSHQDCSSRHDNREGREVCTDGTSTTQPAPKDHITLSEERERNLSTLDDERERKLRELEQQLQSARESEAFFRKHAADATKALSEKNPAHKTLKKVSDIVPTFWDCQNCGNTNPIAGFRCIKCDMTVKQANARKSQLASVHGRSVL